MELREIETFLAIVQCGTFSRAAERLDYSQSAVTVQIRQLEGELGVRLFDRVPRGAVLTEQGRAFAFHANEVMGAVRAARASVEEPGGSAGEMRGVIRLGSAESISTAILPELLVEFHERCPLVQVVVSTDRRESMIEGLRNNALDILLTMERRVCERGLHVEPLRTERVLFVAAPGVAARCGAGPVADEEASSATGAAGRFEVAGAPAAAGGAGAASAPAAAGGAGAPAAAGGAGAVSAPDTMRPTPCSAGVLAQMPFVLTERGESYRLELDRMMAERGLAIAPLVEAGNTETLVHVAERGVGVTFVPRFSAARALEHGTLVEVPCDLPAVEMESQLLWHERKWIAPPMAEFMDVARAYFAR